MDPTLLRHRPSDAVRRRAEAEGIDLEELKRSDPQRYGMLNAGEALRAHPELADLAASALAVAFPERSLFEAAPDAMVRVLVFPPLSEAERRRFDALLAPLTDRPEWRARHAYYREVRDVRGTRHELGLPAAPAAYHGGDGMVGPFADQADADAWAREHVAPPRVHDTVVLGGAWFCDVFPGEPGPPSG